MFMNLDTVEYRASAIVRIAETLYSIVMLLTLVSCSEPITVQTREMDRTYLIVEGLLTDRAGMDQYVKLSESLPYFSGDDCPKVSGAQVVVSDGETETVFTETTEGEYVAPEGFRARMGRTYRLDIEADVAGERHRYHAEADMPDIGFTIDRIDYTYDGKSRVKLDSLWTVLMWGKDDPVKRNIFLAGIAVNGNRIPLSSCLMIEDKFFNGKRIDTFPCGLLYQTAENRKRYGECAKYLEEGDVISVEGYALSDEYFRFLMNIHGDGGGGSSNMPLFATQPANPVTNVTGDGDVLGYFAVCATAVASCTVTDPYQVINYNPL